MSGDGVVYFAVRDDLEHLNQVKIGYSEHLMMRMSQLGAAVILTIPGTPATERAFHERFVHLRVKGEWFHNAGLLRKLLQVMS
jgi:hypothetical protein